MPQRLVTEWKSTVLRRLIALILAFVASIAGIAEPAYAYSNNSGIVYDNHKEEYYNPLQNNDKDHQKNPANSFVDGAVNGVMYAAGAMAACYVLDGLATGIFPPAAALASFCPAIGGATGGARAITGLTQKPSELRAF